MPWRASAELTLFEHLLRQVVLVTDFFDLMQLSFNSVDMLRFVNEDMLQELPAGMLIGIKAGFNPGF